MALKSSASIPLALRASGQRHLFQICNKQLKCQCADIHINRQSITPHSDRRVVEMVGEPKDGDLKKCVCGFKFTGWGEMQQQPQLKLWRLGAKWRPSRNHHNLR
jgi:hypothetical protein